MWRRCASISGWSASICSRTVPGRTSRRHMYGRIPSGSGGSLSSRPVPWVWGSRSAARTGSRSPGSARVSRGSGRRSRRWRRSWRGGERSGTGRPSPRSCTGAWTRPPGPSTPPTPSSAIPRPRASSGVRGPSTRRGRGPRTGGSGRRCSCSPGRSISTRRPVRWASTPRCSPGAPSSSYSGSRASSVAGRRRSVRGDRREVPGPGEPGTGPGELSEGTLTPQGRASPPDPGRAQVCLRAVIARWMRMNAHSSTPVAIFVHQELRVPSNWMMLLMRPRTRTPNRVPRT